MKTAARDMTWPIHGDPDLQELAAWGLDRDKVLDFSVCVNPYGPSPRVPEALLAVRLDRYPDRKAMALRDALVRHLTDAAAGVPGVAAGVSVLRNPGSAPVEPGDPGFRSSETPAATCLCSNDRLRPEQILIGNGVSELIWMTCLAFLKPSDRVLIPQPTYGEYARSALMMHASVVPLPTSEKDGFVLAPDRMRDELCRLQPRMVFLCHPNNPTGNLLDPGTIASWAEAWPECLFVIDEAYLAFADFLAGAAGADNVLVLRSLTKDFALAGLRLGYAVGSLEVVAALERVQPPWSVNALAQAAGIAALGDLGHVRRTVALLHRARASLVHDLAEMGLPPFETAPHSLQRAAGGGGNATHFFLLKVGDGARFRRSLLQQGMLVRDCASFGLPEFVRIATRLPEENRRLIEAIRRSGCRS